MTDAAMVMELDARQRAMLKEMGIPVWLPKTPTVGAVAGSVANGEAVVATPVAPVVQAPRAPRPAPVSPSSPPEQPVSLVHPTAPGAPQDWPALVQASQECQACSLCAGRRHSTLLPAPAGLACDWMVVGDAPHEEEDRAAQPFAAQDGVLLDNMLGALGVLRVNRHVGGSADGSADPGALRPAQRAYVTNAVKCRPAHGQIPQAADIAQCAGFLQQEIALVRPRIIVGMGRFAMQLLLRETPAQAEQPLGRLRGTVHNYQGTAVVLTYHPRALMRHAADKAKAWQDLCLAADVLKNLPD